MKTERDCCPRCGARVTVECAGSGTGNTCWHWCRECKQACDPVRCERD